MKDLCIFFEFWRDIKIYIAPKLIFFIYFWRNIKIYITPKLIISYGNCSWKNQRKGTPKKN